MKVRIEVTCSYEAYKSLLASVGKWMKLFDIDKVDVLEVETEDG